MKIHDPLGNIETVSSGESLGTEEWQVAHAQYVAQKKRLGQRIAKLKRMNQAVVSVWLIMIVFFVLVAVGSWALFAPDAAGK